MHSQVVGNQSGMKEKCWLDLRVCVLLNLFAYNAYSLLSTASLVIVFECCYAVCFGVSSVYAVTSTRSWHLRFNNISQHTHTPPVIIIITRYHRCKLNALIWKLSLLTWFWCLVCCSCHLFGVDAGCRCLSTLLGLNICQCTESKPQVQGRTNIIWDKKHCLCAMFFII